MITRGKILAEDRFGFVEIVTQNRGVGINATFRIYDLDRAGISVRHRRDVRDQRGLVHGAAFLVGKNAIVGEIFFPWLLVSRSDRVTQILGATDQFVLRDCIAGRICRRDIRNKENDRE